MHVRCSFCGETVMTMADPMTDVVSTLEHLEETLESLFTDGRLLVYARDLTRLVGWLRTQSRNRVLLLGALGAGLLVGVILLGTRQQLGMPRPKPADPLDDEPST